MKAPFIAFFIPVLLFAQDKPVPPPTDFKPETSEGKKPLPTITLPQYIITGSEVLQFSDNRKNAIALLSPEDFSSRAGRGSREGQFMDAGPYRHPLSIASLHGNKHSLLMKTGYGLFQTPYAEVWYAKNFLLGDLAARGFFQQNNGFVAHADNQRWSLDLKGGTFVPFASHPLVSRSRIEANFHAGRSEYGLYANALVPESPFDFRRTHTTIRYGGEIISRRNALMDYDVRAFADHSLLWEKLSLRDSSRLQEYRFFENRYGVEGTSLPRFDELPLKTNIAFSFSDNTNSPGSSNPMFLRLHAESRYAGWRDWIVDGGLSFYLYKGSHSATQGSFAPVLEVRYYLHEDVHAFAGFRSEVRQTTYRGLLEQNPYLMLHSPLRHQYIPISLSFGAQYDNRLDASGRVTFAFLQSNSYAWFAKLPEPLHAQWSVCYDGMTSIFSVTGEGQWKPTNAELFSAKLTLRSSENTALESALPYLPEYELQGLYTYTFPFGLALSAAVSIVGNRETNGSTLPSYAVPSLSAEYAITRDFGVFLSAENLFDRKYQKWEGYDEQPFFIIAGIKAEF